MRSTTAHAIALLAGFGACGDDAATPLDAAPDAPAGDAVTLRFAGEIAGAAFACNQTYANIGTPAASYTPSDFRFFIHDIALVGANGPVPLALDTDAFQRDGLALLDFETGTDNCDMGTAATHAMVTGTVPPGGTYTGVTFKLGVPMAMNHLDANTADAPLDDTTLWWVWRSGYRYFKLDGIGGTQPFSIHLGATGCPGPSSTMPPTGPCANPNVAAIALSGFDPTTQTIVADVGPVLATSDITMNTTSTGPGCLADAGDPECDVIFPRLGLAYGATPAGPQVLFTTR